MTYHFYSSQLILLQVLYVLFLKMWLFFIVQNLHQFIPHSVAYEKCVEACSKQLTR